MATTKRQQKRLGKSWREVVEAGETGDLWLSEEDRKKHEDWEKTHAVNRQ